VANVICSHSDPENVHLNIFVFGGSQKEVNVLLSMASKVPIEETELSDDDAPRGGITRDNEMCKATLLKVNGAFHTKRMKEAQADLRQALKETNIVLPTRFLVYSNVTGMPYQSVKQIKKLLVSQITSPVQWFDTILDLKNELSVEKFIECGPMDQLRKMQRSIDVDGSTADMMISSEDFGTASLV
jgi:malonyl CoA-acyl carrier protein transacylase